MTDACETVNAAESAPNAKTTYRLESTPGSYFMGLVADHIEVGDYDEAAVYRSKESAILDMQALNRIACLNPFRVVEAVPYSAKEPAHDPA
jgi:hypothetical protein